MNPIFQILFFFIRFAISLHPLTQPLVAFGGLVLSLLTIAGLVWVGKASLNNRIHEAWLPVAVVAVAIVTPIAMFFAVDLFLYYPTMALAQLGFPTIAVLGADLALVWITLGVASLVIMSAASLWPSHDPTGEKINEIGLNLFADFLMFGLYTFVTMGMVLFFLISPVFAR